MHTHPHIADQKHTHMKLLIYCVIISGLISAVIGPDPSSMKKNISTGELLELDVIVNGPIQYFKHTSEGEAFLYEEAYVGELGKVTKHYIGKQQFEVVEPITKSNYKKILRSYFYDAPDLLGQLGKKGYRFKDLPKWIEFYNKQKYAVSSR